MKHEKASKPFVALLLGGTSSSRLPDVGIATPVEASSRADYLRIIDELQAQGAEAVVLACTEIAMLVKQADTDVRLLDTLAIQPRL